VANWNLSDAAAVAEVLAAAGPFPVIGVQWRNAGLYDASVFSSAWLAAVSGAPATPAPAAAYPVPAAVTVAVRPMVTITWEPGTPLAPHWRGQVAADAGGKPGEVIAELVVTSPHWSVTLPRPGKYWLRLQAAANSPFTAWQPLTA
jgi:hypothetical protein